MALWNTSQMIDFNDQENNMNDGRRCTHILTAMKAQWQQQLLVTIPACEFENGLPSQARQ